MTAPESIQSRHRESPRATCPLLFEPILKPRIWGGRRLERYGKALPIEENIGESWEIADLLASIPDGRSVIASGPLAGQTLREAIERDANRIIMGAADLTTDGGFPVLIKYLDARENLSVQVHPDERYASSHPGAHVKSEAWYIVDAEPGSVIYKGLRPDVTREQFARHVETGEVVDDLIAIEAKPGDCHYLPSGTVHALGAGVLVAEAQTPSDTTFRVYDWGRPGRELHIEQALECIRFGESPPSSREAPPIRAGQFITRDLCETGFFSIEEIRAQAGAALEIITNDIPVVWMLIEGDAVIEMDGCPDTALEPGTTVLLPAKIADAAAHFRRASTFLRIALPSPLRDLIAHTA